MSEENTTDYSAMTADELNNKLEYEPKNLIFKCRKFANGTIDISDMTFQKRISFKNCHFAIELDLSRCHFEKGIEFIGCVFEKEFKMVAAHVIGDCQFRACFFEDKANFDRLKVDGKLDVRAPEGNEPLIGNNEELENFVGEKYKFKQKPYVVFKKEARFSQLHVTGEANFGSVQFWDWADFYNAKIEGATFFRIDYCKKYREAKTDTDKQKYFDDGCFESVVFKKGVRFRFAHFGGELNFHGADFSIAEQSSDEKDKNKWRVDFSFVKCEGIVYFCDSDIKKSKSCNFKTVLLEVEEPQLDFEGASFEKTVRFVSAKFPNEKESGEDKKERLINFRDCSIKGNLEFHQTLPKHLRLSGCSYKRIEVKELDDLIIAIEYSEDKSYDRRSWIQLESTLRAEGRVEDADKVYVKRREARFQSLSDGFSKELDKQFGKWTRYGTDNKRMMKRSFGIIVIAALLFMFFGTFKQENNNHIEYMRLMCNQPISQPDQGCNSVVEIPGAVFPSIVKSLEQFLPFEIPMSDEYKPADGLTKFIAIIEKLLGWVLIPLLAANLSGFLHNKAKPGGDN